MAGRVTAYQIGTKMPDAEFYLGDVGPLTFDAGALGASPFRYDPVIGNLPPPVSGDFVPWNWFTAVGGVGFEGNGVKLNGSGKIDPSMIEDSTLVNVNITGSLQLEFLSQHAGEILTIDVDGNVTSVAGGLGIGDFVRTNGTTALTGDWNIGSGRLGLGVAPALTLHAAIDVNSQTDIAKFQNSNIGALAGTRLYVAAAGGGTADLGVASNTGDARVVIQTVGETWYFGADQSVVGVPLVWSAGSGLGSGDAMSLTIDGALTLASSVVVPAVIGNGTSIKIQSPDLSKTLEISSLGITLPVLAAAWNTGGYISGDFCLFNYILVEEVKASTANSLTLSSQHATTPKQIVLTDSGVTLPDTTVSNIHPASGTLTIKSADASQTLSLSNWGLTLTQLAQATTTKYPMMAATYLGSPSLTDFIDSFSNHYEIYIDGSGATPVLKFSNFGLSGTSWSLTDAGALTITSGMCNGPLGFTGTISGASWNITNSGIGTFYTRVSTPFIRSVSGDFYIHDSADAVKVTVGTAGVTLAGTTLTDTLTATGVASLLIRGSGGAGGLTIATGGGITANGALHLVGNTVDGTGWSLSGAGALTATTGTFSGAVSGVAGTFTGMVTLATGTTVLAPLKFTSGVNLTTAVVGTVEFTVDDLFFTISTGIARKRLLMADPVGGLTPGRVPFATANGRLTDSANLTFSGTTLGVSTIQSTATLTLYSAFNSSIILSNSDLTLTNVVNGITLSGAVTLSSTLSVSTSISTPSVLGKTTTLVLQGQGAVGGITIAGAGGVTLAGAITCNSSLTLRAGTITAGTAPLYFVSGTSLTVPVLGAVEFTTDDLFFTISTGTARKRLLMADPVGGLTPGRVPYVTTNGRLTDEAAFAYDDSTNILSVNGFRQVTAGTSTWYDSTDTPRLSITGSGAKVNGIFSISALTSGRMVFVGTNPGELSDDVGLTFDRGSHKLSLANIDISSTLNVVSSISTPIIYGKTTTLVLQGQGATGGISIAQTGGVTLSGAATCGSTLAMAENTLSGTGWSVANTGIAVFNASVTTASLNVTTSADRMLVDGGAGNELEVWVKVCADCQSKTGVNETTPVPIHDRIQLTTSDVEVDEIFFSSGNLYSIPQAAGYILSYVKFVLVMANDTSYFNARKEDIVMGTGGVSYTVDQPTWNATPLTRVVTPPTGWTRSTMTTANYYVWKWNQSTYFPKTLSQGDKTSIEIKMKAVTSVANCILAGFCWGFRRIAV